MIQTPATLRDITVNAFIRFLQHLIIKLQTCVQTRIPPTVEEFKTTILYPVCCFISDLVTATVPSTLANDFSDRLCIHLLTVKLIGTEDSDSSLTSDVKETCIEIMNAIISAVIHPSTTTFDFPPYRMLEGETHVQYTVRKLNLTKILEKLRTIRVLKLNCIPNTNITSLHSWSFIHLQEFTFVRDCSNSVVEIISKYSQNLVKLDLNFSKAVTDEVVKHFFSFKKLEYLDIIETGISSQGLMLIMTGLKQSNKSKNDLNTTKLSLKVFNGDFNDSHFALLPEHFPELTSFCVQYNINRNLKFLQKLKNLKSLSFASRGRFGIRFSKIKNLLSVVGGQIVHLDFRKQSNLDLCFIAEKCPCLQSLTLRYFDYDLHRLFSNPEPNFSVGNLPEIASVTLCEINITFYVQSICYFLSRLVNLKTLKIHWIDPSARFTSVLEYVLERMKNSQLSEVLILSILVTVVDGAVMIQCGDRYHKVENASEFESIVKKIISKPVVFR